MKFKPVVTGLVAAAIGFAHLAPKASAAALDKEGL